LDYANIKMHEQVGKFGGIGGKKVTRYLLTNI